MPSVISVAGLTKTYASGFQALKAVDLEIERGEIFALLGPNGAGKTTLISAVCGTVNLTAGKVTVAGHDILTDYREARRKIGLVPQEISLDPFETVLATVRYTRGLFGKGTDDAYLETLLRDLSLWDKRGARTLMLSGGMKRRVMIAKALSHEPEILFLDEPTAGVDVELRRDMWAMVRKLRSRGTTIILTTHYIEEAEDLADRVGVISNGAIILVERKDALMDKLGRKQLSLQLRAPLDAIPGRLAGYGLDLAEGGRKLVYTYAAQAQASNPASNHASDVAALLRDVEAEGIGFTDLQTRQSSLEDIFVDLVSERQ